MDVNTQISGLEELLSVIYSRNIQLSELLHELGFEQVQVAQLHAKSGQLESVVNQFLTVIHKRLTSDSGKDTYYQILSSRYGLDGEARQQLSMIAEKFSLSPDYLRLLYEDIIHRCQSKVWQTELKKSLKHIVVNQLGIMQERPAREHVAEKLERLSTLRNAVEFTRLDYETRQKEIRKQIQAELDALEAEYQPVIDAALANIAALENEIKTDVLLCGESISGGMYRAVYTQGRVSWDNDGMATYALSHPDVLPFRKQGQPSVALRVVDRN